MRKKKAKTQVRKPPAILARLEELARQVAASAARVDEQAARMEGVIRDNIAILKDVRELGLRSLMVARDMEHEEQLRGMKAERRAPYHKMAEQRAHKKLADQLAFVRQNWDGCAKCGADPCECNGVCAP